MYCSSGLRRWGAGWAGVVITVLVLLPCRGGVCDPDVLGSSGDKAHGKRDEVLLLLQDGMRALLVDDSQQAIKSLSEAERRIDALRPKSVSETLLSYAVNDRQKAFIGELYEQAYVNYYLAIAYLMLDKYEDALVEARKLNLMLEKNDQLLRGVEDVRNRYRYDPGPRVLAAVLHEAEGESDDAFIDYYQAAKEYLQDYGSQTGISLPDIVRESLWELGEKLGRVDDVESLGIGRVAQSDRPREAGKREAEVRVELAVDDGGDDFFDDGEEASNQMTGAIWGEESGDGEEEEGAFDMARDRGMCFLILELGKVPAKGERHINIPIPPAAIPDGWKGELSVGTVIPVVLPEVKRRASSIVDARVVLDGEYVDGLSTVADLGAIAKLVLDDRMAGIKTKTVVRSLLKQGAAQWIERKVSKRSGSVEGLIAGLVAKGVAYASEKADTRSWQELPQRIAMGRWPIEAGVGHVLEIEYLDRDGNTIANERFKVVAPKGRGVIAWRRACQ